MTKPFQVCYLHIGAEKTGSTSLQAFLKANRDRLKAHGYLFPYAPGDDNQPALAAYAQEDTSDKNLMGLAHVRADESIEAFRARLEKAMDEEAAAASGLKALVLTNEHCHSRIHTPEEAARLAAFLRRYADEVRIIFYVRRQDLAAISLLTTALKMGHTRIRPQMNIKTMVLYYNYWRIAEMYEQAFGEGTLTVRLFDRAHFKDGDLIVDFCDLLSLPADAEWEEIQPQNLSIQPIAQRFLSTFNKLRNGGNGPKADGYRRDLIAMLEDKFTGKGVMPPKDYARKFQNLYRWSNEKLRKRYFPDLPAPLFGDDFSMYGDSQKDWMPTPQDALTMGAELWIEQQARIEKLEAEIEALKARKTGKTKSRAKD
ncbi:hypothetical protein [Kordiimonas marina]|uniref:hypothetical protein n=1 Tax=Kordiimonas marina TaxID=2872312 RepID=UPI001FF59606|nr:hypothetical protein [Kordiimonas marina]MCJ9429806.1 hypothetical protein [Kordiimonas marina]